MKVVDDYQIRNKVGYFVMENACDNFTFVNTCCARNYLFPIYLNSIASSSINAMHNNNAFQRDHLEGDILIGCPASNDTMIRAIEAEISTPEAPWTEKQHRLRYPTRGGPGRAVLRLWTNKNPGHFSASGCPEVSICTRPEVL